MKKARSKKHFPIVAIGASAGGMKAITELLKHLPAETGMAYIYIQHLDPNLPTKLVEVLQRNTKMKVTEAKHLTAIETDHLYVIPPNKEMTLTDGVLTLNARREIKGMAMPIDQFFISLAEKHEDAAIGIVLSGSASDGALGLKAIKAAGGITMAQDDTAEFQSMPKSAIAEDAVDRVMSPAAMAAELERLGKQSGALLRLQDEGDVVMSEVDEDLKNILQLLRKSTGVDFAHYKMNTIRRRIVRRMLLYKLDTLSDYLQYLKQHAGEANLLYQDLLINVTSFFRDPDTIEYLKKTILPRIIKAKSANDPIRIWVPACSTGEEAYSLAMIFMEVLGERAANTAIQIFATDLSEVAITKARLGLYTRNDVANVSPGRLQRFFTKIDGSYRIVKSIRDLCVFAPHNIFKDPPFSRIDLVSCCNLMIYLDTFLQKKILATFHYALNHDGLLVLGKSETINASSKLFSPLEKKYKVFVKRTEAAAGAIFDMNYHLPELERAEKLASRRTQPKASEQNAELEKMVDTLLLDKYVPASVVVNQDLEIIQFRGSTGLYLEPSPGRASLNLLKMARPGLAFELRNIIHKSGKTGQSVKRTGLEIKINEISHLVSVEAVPLKSDSEDKLFLVLFEQLPMPELTQLRGSLSKDKLVRQLEEELKSVREDMRSIIEEQEASNEELQSANEEIVSSNEELQSINEELETSKEELESANEELMTINAELQVRNEQLAEAYEYAEAVFGIIREAVLVLDRDLRIKSANRSFYQIFRMKEEETEGMLIYELQGRKWDIPQLRQLLEDLIPRQGQYQGMEITHEFPETGKKVLLVNGCRVVQRIHQQQLILLAFEDITDWRGEGRP